VTHVPDNLVVVPYDAEYVRVVLEVEQGPPFVLGLKYHGANTREFQEAVAVDGTETRTEYEIEVQGAGDGPYAIQSQWEFVPYPASPQENGFMVESYTITATAEK
jgi:hypothetical protein